MFLAIPFFKNVPYLKETIESVLAQTDAHWNLVVLDDSIDSNEAQAARQCVHRFADRRITYHQNERNLGLARNWNQAFELAKSQGHELMEILHADDRLKPDYVAQMKCLASRYPEAAGFFCKVEVIGAQGEKVFSMADRYKEMILPKEKEIILSGDDGIEKLIPGNFVFCPSLCYRLSVVASERYRVDLKMVLDFELILRFLQKGYSWVGYYDHALFEYRRHPNNLTNQLNQDLSRFYEEKAIYEGLKKMFLAKGKPHLAKKAGKMQVLKLNLGFQMIQSLFRFQWRAFLREARLLGEFFKLPP